MPESFYLRFRDPPPETTRAWVRNGLFVEAYRKTTLFETASEFKTREEAIAFAAKFRIGDVVELVVVRTEAVAP